METHAQKVLQAAQIIYNMRENDIVTIKRDDNTTWVFKCQCIDENYDLYDTNNKNISWGMSCGSLEELQDELLKDCLDRCMIAIHIHEVI